MKKDELETKVEEIKKDEQVQRALKRAATTEKEKVRARVRIHDKLVIGTHIVLLVVLGVFYQVIDIRFKWFFQSYPLVKKLIIALAVAVVCLMILRLVEVFVLGRVGNAVHKYNLNRVLRLVVWL